MIITDNQGNLHASNGQFANKQSRVDNNAGARLLGATDPFAAPRKLSAVIAEPLTAKEVGYRMDENGRITALMALQTDELNVGDERTSDALGQRLVGEKRYALQDTQITPVSVDREHRVVCEVSADATGLVDEFDDGELEDFNRGTADRLSYGSNRRDSAAYNPAVLLDPAVLLQSSTDLYPVPELPEGFENPEVSVGYNKHTDDPQITLYWPQGRYEHAPSQDGYEDSYEDSHFEPELTEKQKDLIDEYAWAVGKNYIRMRGAIMSNVERAEGYEAEMTARILAGGTLAD